MKLTMSNNSGSVIIDPPINTLRSIHFDTTKVYQSTRINHAHAVFDVVNAYISGWDYKEQLILFNYYSEAKEALITSTTDHGLDNVLKDLCTRIVDLVDLNRLEYYVDINSGLNIPATGSIKASYDEVNPQYTEQKTYIRFEYIQLITLSVLYRFFIPIWDEYIGVIKNVTTAEGGENRAFNLLAKSAVIQYPAYMKLLTYAEAHMVEAVNTSAATLSGVGRDRIPTWLTALVSVRKLPLVELKHHLIKDGELVKALFSFVNQRLTRLPKNFMSEARERAEPKDSDEEQDVSFFDSYRAKQPLNYGQMVTHTVYFNGQSNDFIIRLSDGEEVLASTNPKLHQAVLDGKIIGEVHLAPPSAEESFNALYNVCLDVDETVPEDLLRQVLSVMEGLEREETGEHNKLLSKWLLYGVLPDVAIDVMTREVMIKSLIVSQTLLHHWGLHDLALCATGIPIYDYDGAFSMDRLDNPSSAEMELLIAKYPHTKPIGSKGQPRAKQVNYGYLGSMGLATLLTQYPLIVRVPSFLTQADVKVNAQGLMHVPNTIIHQIVSLLDKLNQLDQ